MLTPPSGEPAVVKPADYDWERVQRDVDHLINPTPENATKRNSWRAWIAARPRTLADANDARFPKPSFGALPTRPGEPVRLQQGPAGLSKFAFVYDQPRTVASSVSTGAEGAAVRRAAARARAGGAEAAASTRRDPLVAGDFVFAKANWDNDGGFQIPLILLQLPDDFEGKDTTDENLKLKPKWYASRRCAANRSSR